MSFEVKTSAYNLQIFEPGEYLQSIDNLVYLLQFNCTSCFTKNTLMFDRHVIDNELEDKQIYEREEVCASCGKKTKIEFRKKIEVKVKE